MKYLYMYCKLNISIELASNSFFLKINEFDVI